MFNIKTFDDNSNVLFNGNVRTYDEVIELAREFYLELFNEMPFDGFSGDIVYYVRLGGYCEFYNGDNVPRLGIYKI